MAWGCFLSKFVWKAHLITEMIAISDFFHARNANVCFSHQDVVTRAGKFLWLYKRPGQRVIIDQLGDLVVKPNRLEFNLRSGQAEI